MLVRDDEDLAIDQLAAAGRADDPQLTRLAIEPLQQQEGDRAETPSNLQVRSCRLGGCATSSSDFARSSPHCRPSRSNSSTRSTRGHAH